MAGHRRTTRPTRAAADLAKAYDQVRTTASALDRAVPGSGDRLRMDVASAVQGALTRAVGVAR